MGLCGLYNNDASVGAEHNSIEHAHGNAEMSVSYRDIDNTWCSVEPLFIGRELEKGVSIYIVPKPILFI